jgi:hypothetical protein
MYRAAPALGFKSRTNETSVAQCDPAQRKGARIQTNNDVEAS